MYDMMERVIEQQLPVSGVLLQRRDLIHLEISPNEWRILEDVVQLLRPFKVATEYLSGERYPTISALGPLLNEIHKKVSPCSDDSIAVREFKKALPNDLAGRYVNPDIRGLLRKASFVDPRFKTLNHLSASEQEEVIDSIFEETMQLTETNPLIMDEQQGSSCNTPEMSEPQRKKKKNALAELIGNQFLQTQNTIGTTNTSTTHRDLVQSELFRYKAEPSIPVHRCPLKWWIARKCIYPNLSLIARKYMCIVATSVPSEQLFSTAGNIVSVKRAALLPENVDKLVFLHGNLPPLHLDYRRTQDKNCMCELCNTNNDE